MQPTRFLLVTPKRTQAEVLTKAGDQV